MASDVPEEGDVLTYRRAFTTDEVRDFGEITGDQQAIHTEPDEDGRLVVQGLLTGSLMTKIGGDLRFIARTMAFEFRQPVRTGEAVTCEWTVDSREEREDRYLYEGSVVFSNEDGEVVADASVSGLVRK